MKKATFSGTKWILCKALPAAVLLGLTACANVHPKSDAEVSVSAVSAEESSSEAALDSASGMSGDVFETKVPVAASVEISFDFERMSTLASNQVAVWVEDANRELVRTILVTNFTAARRGYRNRNMSLSHWVSAAEPEKMSDDQIDILSSATPGTGHLVCSWDLTDQNGSRVPDGVYTVYVEGTLFWESNVLFSASFDTRSTEPKELTVEMMRSDPDSSENETMLGNVRISVLA